VAAVAVVLGGCQYPKDPDGTFNRVTGGTMRVGVTNAPPWAELKDGKPVGGLEVELVEDFARVHGAKIQWVDGSEEELMHAMKEGAIDMVIGGITAKSRWKKEAAFTKPYLKSQTVIGAPPGSSVDPKLKMARVNVERGSEEAGLAEKKFKSADIRVEETLTGANGEPVIAPAYVLDDLKYQQLKPLKKDKHVLALPLGENAWMVEWERFILGREPELGARLMEVGKP